MANRRLLLADLMPNYHRSFRKVLSICSKNHSASFNSFDGGRLPSSIQSSEQLLPRPRLSIQPLFITSASSASSLLRVFGKTAIFPPTPRNFSTLQAAAAPPIRSSSPYLIIPPDIDHPKLIADSEMEAIGKNCYRLLSPADEKVVKINKNNLRLQWQRDILVPANKDDLCVGSSHGWLAFINQTSCALYLFDPFNIDSFPLSFFSLPPIESLPSIISSVRRKSTTGSIVREFTCPTKISLVSSKEISEHFITKLVLSSNPCNNDVQDCTVMAIQGYAQGTGGLAFCRPGDTVWTPLEEPLGSYEELLFFSKDRHFYALSSGGCIESWDLRDPASPKRTLVKTALPPTRYPPMAKNQSHLRIDNTAQPKGWYLVESSGDLLMVVRYIAFIVDENGDAIPEGVDSPRYRTTLFDIYKLDFVKKKWVYVPNLGDRALFLGLNHSVSLSARDYPGLKGNAIYFSPVTESYWGNTIGGHELGVFNLEDNIITPFYGGNFKNIQPPVWIIPQLRSKF